MDTVDTKHWIEVTSADLIAKFQQATVLRQEHGVTYLEHPLYGDEVEIYARKDGVLYNTGDFDFP